MVRHAFNILQQMMLNLSLESASVCLSVCVSLCVCVCVCVCDKYEIFVQMKKTCRVLENALTCFGLI